MKKSELFNKIFEKGITYEEYIKKGDRYLERMKNSWTTSKKEINKISQAQISRMNEKMLVLCIAENWCGDCANGVPVIAKLADVLDNWDFRIIGLNNLFKEMEMEYTTAGRMKIPIVIFADEDGDEIMRWVERPTRSYHLLGMLRNQNLSKEEFIEQYKTLDELNTPSISREILRELIYVADKASSIVHLHPPKKKPKILIH